MKTHGGSLGEVTPEDFVRVWQSSAHLEDVAETLGQSFQTVLVRATRYRKKGVPLRHLTSRTRSAPFTVGGSAPVDWTALAELAKSLL